MLVTKANAGEEETQWAVQLYHKRNQSIHVTDGTPWRHFLLPIYRI
jgi:hypothetical protein